MAAGLGAPGAEKKAHSSEQARATQAESWTLAESSDSSRLHCSSLTEQRACARQRQQACETLAIFCASCSAARSIVTHLRAAGTRRPPASASGASPSRVQSGARLA